MRALKMSWNTEGGRLVCRWVESEECENSLVLCLSKGFTVRRRAAAALDRDREKRLSVLPPSKPEGRVSRNRLSSRWFTSERIDRSEPERRGEIAPAQPRPPRWPCTPEGPSTWRVSRS